MLTERLRVAPIDFVGKMQVDDAVGFAVFVLGAAQEHVFGSKLAFAFTQAWKRRRIVHLNALGYVILDRFDQDVPASCKLEPVSGRWVLCNERSTALLGTQQALFAQNIDSLAHSNARHLEFAFELNKCRNLLTETPLFRFDPSPHDRSDLDVQRKTASVIGLRKFGHGSLLILMQF